MKNKSLGGILIIVSSFFYASYGIWTTLMGDYFGGFTASAIRSILVLILLFPLAVYTKQIEKLDIKNNGQKITAMILISTLIWGPLYFAALVVNLRLFEGVFEV